MTRKIVAPRKAIADMTFEEMRLLLARQAETSRVRGVEYRAKQRKKRLVRFSVFVPEDALDDVRKIIVDFLNGRRLAKAEPLVPFTVDVGATAGPASATPMESVEGVHIVSPRVEPTIAHTGSQP